MEKQTQIPKRRRLVLVPYPYQGHITPMLQLGSFLHNNGGFSITIAHTRFNAPDPSNFPHFQFLFLDDGISDRKAIPADLIQVMLDINFNCRASFKDEMRKLIAGAAAAAEEEEEVVAGVIHDELMLFCEEIASDLKMWSFVLRTTSAASSLARMALLRLSHQGYFPLKESMLQDPAPEAHPLRFKDLPITLTTGFTKYSTVVKRMYNMETPTKAKAIIWNTIDWLEKSTIAEIKSKSMVPIFPIGPLHKMASTQTSVLDEDSICLRWLDKQAQGLVIYVAIGSIASLSEKELGEMAWGLANSQQPFLWVVQPGAVRGSEWIEALPNGFQEAVGGRGCVVKWAPQKEVLGHRAVGGFWSHCGWNSSMESLSLGIPMLCSPCFGDQKVNARYLSYVWRVGLQLENGLERGEIENGIIRLMVEEEGKEMRGRAKHLKEKIEANVFNLEDRCSSTSYFKDLISLLNSSN